MKLIHKLILGYIIIITIFWGFGYLTISFNKKVILDLVTSESELLASETLENISRQIRNRYEIFQEYTMDSELREAVLSSNRDFDKLNDIQAHINKKELEWTSSAKEEVTPFMHDLINNGLSNNLREKMAFYNEKAGYRIFGEVFITNKYGINIAQTGKTSDYRQDDEEWWQIAKKDSFYAKNIEYDESAGIYSLAIGMRIDDRNGNYIGVMKIVMSLEEVFDILETISKKNTHSEHRSMQYYLITGDGKLIYSNASDINFLEEVSFLVPEEHLSPVPGHPLTFSEGDLSGNSLIAQSHSAKFEDNNVLDWIFVIKHDSEELFAPFIKLRRRLLISLIFITICGIPLSFLLTYPITRNIRKLHKAARKVGKGDMDIDVDMKSNDEIGQLSVAFKKMSEDLKLIAVSRDELTEEVNKRIHAEETILHNEERFRSVVETANDAIIYIDNLGEIISWNQAAEKIFGYSAEEMVGSQVNAIIPERNRKAHKEGIARVIETGETRIIGKTVELSGLRKDGTELPIELSLSRWEIGNGMFFTAIIRDISERRHSEEVIQRQVNHLSALRSIDKAIISSLDLDVTLDVFLTHVMAELHVDAASVLILNRQTQILEYVMSKGFKTAALKYTRLRLGESNAGRAAVEHRIISIPDLNDRVEVFIRSDQFASEGFVSYLAIPLIAKGETMGVLEIFHRSPLDIKPDWSEFLEAIANQGAIALDNSFLFSRLQRSNIELSLAYDRTIEGWSMALDMRDKETEGHSQRVTEITVRIAHEFRLNDEEITHIRRGALLHDIGKMGIPDSILLKPGKLTDEEWIIMKLHPVYAHDLLYPIEYLRPSLDIPYSHHEKWDGTGYPKGLRGEDIPLAARIFSVVDVWDALCSDRPYRPAWPEVEVLEHIKSLIGSHFDARIVEMFLRMGGE